VRGGVLSFFLRGDRGLSHASLRVVGKVLRIREGEGGERVGSPVGTGCNAFQCVGRLGGGWWVGARKM